MDSLLENSIYLGKQDLILHTYTETEQNTWQIEKLCDGF